MDRAEAVARLRSGRPAPDPSLPLVIDRFRPGDALAVCRLILDVYGDGHPLDYVYDPEALAARFASGDHRAVLARTSAGEAAGLMAAYRSAPWPDLWEIGQLMVAPAWRDGPLAMRLWDAVLKTVLPEAGAAAVFGESVTSHEFSQAMCLMSRLAECALEVEAAPDRAFGGGAGRASLLVSARVLRDEPRTLHPPDFALDLVGLALAGLKLERVRAEGGKALPDGPGRIKTTSFDGFGLVRIEVEEAGSGMDELAGRAEGRSAAVQAVLNLGSPSTPAAAEALRRRGYFCGGVLPCWFGPDGLLMQRLARPPDWEAIRPYSRRGRELRNLVRAAWEASLRV